ncbi:nucleoid-structuring protein H-NS, partial [candidate division MSBL1 archaeon SCGC-AAA259J03]
MGKGSRAERELVNIFWESGFAVMRSPASGSGRKHPQPDILVSDGEKIFGIETKSTSSDVVYIRKEEIEKLEEFCEKFGCDPLIGIRFDWKGWVFFHPGECKKTE